MGEDLRPETESPDEDDDASECTSEYSDSTAREIASDDDRQDGCEGGGDAEAKKKKKKRKVTPRAGCRNRTLVRTTNANAITGR